MLIIQGHGWRTILQCSWQNLTAKKVQESFKRL